MRSNYKRLGDFIIPINDRNVDLQKKILLGVSIQKEFIPSIANIIGTDMSTYKIIRKRQFAYGPVTSRNGDKISIALLEDYEEALISPAYISFEVVNPNILLPEYLMMWFCRSEFDRYARFKSFGSARETFDWDELCNVLLPIPSIEIQKENFKEYNTVLKRIKLNNNIIQKLEESAKALYKQWFIDFEFPNANNKPYKSSGGRIKQSNSDSLPEGWVFKKISEICDCNVDTISNLNKLESIEYLDTGSITNNIIYNTQTLIIGKDEIPSRAKRKVKHNDIVYSTIRPNLRHFGLLINPKYNMIVSTGFAVLSIKSSLIFPEYVFLLLTLEEQVKKMQDKAEMSVSTYPSINPDDLLSIDCLIPTNDVIQKTGILFSSIFKYGNFIKKENSILTSFCNSLQSKGLDYRNQSSK